jgi:hypothetical protein
MMTIGGNVKEEKIVARRNCLLFVFVFVFRLAIPMSEMVKL